MGKHDGGSSDTNTSTSNGGKHSSGTLSGSDNN